MQSVFVEDHNDATSSNFVSHSNLDCISEERNMTRTRVLDQDAIWNMSVLSAMTWPTPGTFTNLLTSPCDRQLPLFVLQVTVNNDESDESYESSWAYMQHIQANALVGHDRRTFRKKVTESKVMI